MITKTLTVFTPTYNRAYCLHHCYESLCRQTSKDFVWFIIDDGSVDNTKELVEGWIETQTEFEIRYYYKENGGLHTAYNEAIRHLESQLAVCIDSDDFMPDDAVEAIVDFWNKNGSDQYAGIIGQDFYIGGGSIGGELPNVKSLNFLDLQSKYGYRGDTKMVHRTELLKKVAPQPTYNNEKNFNPIYMFLKIDESYPLLVLNRNLCFVDYQIDGMSNAIYRQYMNSPYSFAELRKLGMTLKHANFKYKIRQVLHFISSCFITKDIKLFFSSPMLLLSIIFLPLGYLLSIYIRYKSTISSK